MVFLNNLIEEKNVPCNFQIHFQWQINTFNQQKKKKGLPSFMHHRISYDVNYEKHIDIIRRQKGKK